MTKFIISVQDLDASFVTMTNAERRVQMRRSEGVFLRFGMDMREHGVKTLHECSSIEVEGFRRGYDTAIIGQYDMGGMTDTDAMFWDKDEQPCFLAKGDMDECKFPEEPSAWLANEKPSESRMERFAAAFYEPQSKGRNGQVPDDEWDRLASDGYTFDEEFFGCDAASEWLNQRERSSHDMARVELDGGRSVFADLYL